MTNLLQYLLEHDLFMSQRPDVLTDSMVFTFRKTDSSGKIWNRNYRLTCTELSCLSVDICDVLQDFAERFMEEFEKQEKGE